MPCNLSIFSSIHSCGLYSSGFWSAVINAYSENRGLIFLKIVHFLIVQVFSVAHYFRTAIMLKNNIILHQSRGSNERIEDFFFKYCYLLIGLSTKNSPELLNGASIGKPNPPQKWSFRNFTSLLLHCADSRSSQSVTMIWVTSHCIDRERSPKIYISVLFLACTS